MCVLYNYIHVYSLFSYMHFVLSYMYTCRQSIIYSINQKVHDLWQHLGANTVRVLCILVYRARPSLPCVILLSHALNYKRVWSGGLAEVISIHEALTNQIAVQIRVTARTWGIYSNMYIVVVKWVL